METAIPVISLCFGSGCLVSAFQFLYRKIKVNDSKTESVQLGVQALLRDRLIQMYDHYMEKGYAPVYARENFENMYNQYHNLGANGVMDDMCKKFFELPVKLEQPK